MTGTGTSGFGGSNIAIGASSLYNLSTGNANLAFGMFSGGNITTGINNIFIGDNAGYKAGAGNNGSNSSGQNSVFIGYNARPAANGETNEVVLSGYDGSNPPIGLGSNTTLIGNASTTTTKIWGALNIPDATASTSKTTGSLTVGGGAGINGALYVGGQISIAGGSPGAGKVLTSDANGLATWSNGAGTAVSTPTAAYAITLAESIVFYTGTAAGTFSIPAAATSNSGKQIIIKNKTGYGITITPATGSIYIDNANSAAASVSIGIEASNNWIKLVSDGSQWNVLRALF
jgi:hypothetical protein